jgi:hypothetical protein
MKDTQKAERLRREQHIKENPEFYSNVVGYMGTYTKAFLALGQLTTHGRFMTQMLLALVYKIAKKEIWEKKLTDKMDQISKMRLIRYAYLSVLAELKAQKEFRELLELEEENDHDCEAEWRRYASGASNKPLSFTLQPAVSPEQVYYDFELSAGVRLSDLQAKLKSFLQEIGATGLRVSCQVAHNVLHLVVPEGCPAHTHAEKMHLAGFLDMLVKQGAINPVGQQRLLAMPVVLSPEAGGHYTSPRLVPNYRPTVNTEQTEEEKKAAQAKGGLQPKLPGTAK